MIVIASKSADPSTPRPPAHDPYLFGDVGSGYWRFNVQPSWRPPTDVYETEEAIMVRMEIAGMNESDFVIELKGRLLLIRARAQTPMNAAPITRWKSGLASSM